MKISFVLPHRILTTIFLIPFLITQVYADDACVIKNEMSPELASYIKTTENLLSRIREEAGKNQCNSNKNRENSALASIRQAGSVTMGAFNEVLGFSNFYTSIEFFSLSMLGSPPPAIMRDHTRLGKELERIKSTIDMVYNQCAGNIPVGDILKEDTAYNVSGSTLGEILTEILKNQIIIINIYRGVVIGKNISEPNLILVGKSEDFQTHLKENYGKQKWSGIGGACASKFETDVKDAFQRIKDGGENISDGTQSWKDAAALLTGGSDTNKYKDTEQELLKKELSKQGMSTKSSEAIMNNLKNYNSNTSGNGVTGFVNSVGSRIMSSIDQITQIFKGLQDHFSKEETTIDKRLKEIQVLQTEQAILKEITTEYISNKNLIGPENQNVDETVAKLLDTHILLENTNNLARSYIKIAEQTCDGQANGKGNCKF